MTCLLSERACRCLTVNEFRIGKLFAESWRASLARTAEGGCPHVVIGCPNLMNLVG
jgi:hypothetical protein